LSPFAFSVGKTYGALLDTGGRRAVRKGRRKRDVRGVLTGIAK